ncbi:ArsR/SmtB family transcription factor [Jannaschia seohaensis]|uniref:DNA-binding transcriptional ArsR family regulator n=1 Tax=Jannaschia seohaensis TaxID=475081 RepID=A0A2Y9BXR4_9RHOB|nr:metalloregulator ArsR/SmtB family transcription factor [Jannaschia seohaensis]PWJ20872.1 DNA-binding transcriptional ArsR family regulator [Jannaschia seohaensis]SSA41282.1 DNA-binding transcriptional regulator, ArsR family [Jannaschia seohaensis]
MDTIFKALADPSRRDLLDALRQADGQTLSELEATLPISRFGVAKHLKILEEAGLITRLKRGRYTHHYLNAVPLAEALNRWVEPFEVAPAASGLLALKARLEAEEEAPDVTHHSFIRCSRDALWRALRIGARRPLRPGPDSAVIAAETGTRLVTRLPPLGALPETRVIYDIASEDGHQHLTVGHYGLPQPLRAQVAENWARWSAALKTFLETGEAVAFPRPG